MKIGYLGPEGTFSELALDVYIEKSGVVAEKTPAASIFALFDALQSEELEEIIVPLENSVEGAVTATLDAVIRSENVHMTGEIVFPVEHCLMAQKGVTSARIEMIMSHPQPLSQCQLFLHQEYPHARLHATPSTAEAVQLLQRPGTAIDPEKTAVIGSLRLARLTGLEVLHSAIQDYPGNSTRFVVLSHHATCPTGSDRTSLAVSTMKDSPGSLYALLKIFAAHEINLTRIESRPSKAMLGEYIFYIDCDGHCLDTTLAPVLAEVKAAASFYRELGSYPRFTP